MTKVCEVFEELCRLAPTEIQKDFDNSGFLLGYAGSELDAVLLSLDVTDELVDEAIRCGAGLIVSHHPLIFHPLRSLTDESPEGRRILKLVEHGIAVISMHTNLDIVEGGVNDVLMAALGGKTEGTLDEDGCGRVGVLDVKLPLKDFLGLCKGALRCPGLRYVDAHRPVYRIAVLGGSGADALEQAAAVGCDTYVTADVKYHQFQKALELGINLIDAGHFCTENPVVPMLAERLRERFPDLSVLISEVHGPIIHYA